MNKIRLEEGILKAWNVVDDLDLLLRGYPDGMTKDQIYAYLAGLREITDARFEELWDIFEDNF